MFQLRVFGMLLSRVAELRTYEGDKLMRGGGSIPHQGSEPTLHQGGTKTAVHKMQTHQVKYGEAWTKQWMKAHPEVRQKKEASWKQWTKDHPRWREHFRWVKQHKALWDQYKQPLPFKPVNAIDEGAKKTGNLLRQRESYVRHSAAQGAKNALSQVAMGVSSKARTKMVPVGGPPPPGVDVDLVKAQVLPAPSQHVFETSAGPLFKNNYGASQGRLEMDHEDYTRSTNSDPKMVMAIDVEPGPTLELSANSVNNEKMLHDAETRDGGWWGHETDRRGREHPYYVKPHGSGEGDAKPIEKFYHELWRNVSSHPPSAYERDFFRDDSEYFGPFRIDYLKGTIELEDWNFHVHDSKNRKGHGNFAVGPDQDFIQASNSFVVGDQQTVIGNGNALLGGTENTVSGEGNVVDGGEMNVAEGNAEHIFGGFENEDLAQFGVVIGGDRNDVKGAGATIMGGSSGEASGDGSVVAGGYENKATAIDASVLGGSGGDAENVDATVLGGMAATSNFTFDITAGPTPDPQLLKGEKEMNGLVNDPFGAGSLMLAYGANGGDDSKSPEKGEVQGPAH